MEQANERAEQWREAWARECETGLPWVSAFPTKEEANNYVIRTYGATLDELLAAGIDPFM